MKDYKIGVKYVTFEEKSIKRWKPEKTSMLFANKIVNKY